MKATANVETRFRALVSLVVIAGGKPHAYSNGDDVDPEVLGDQLQSHLDAGHVESYQDVQVVMGDGVTTMDDAPAKKSSAGRKNAPKNPDAPKNRSGKKPAVETKGDQIIELSQVPNLDGALVSTLESSGVTTVELLRELTAEKLAEIGGISEERANEILESVKVE